MSLAFITWPHIICNGVIEQCLDHSLNDSQYQFFLSLDGDAGGP